MSATTEGKAYILLLVLSHWYISCTAQLKPPQPDVVSSPARKQGKARRTAGKRREAKGAVRDIRRYEGVRRNIREEKGMGIM